MTCRQLLQAILLVNCTNSYFTSFLQQTESFVVLNKESDAEKEADKQKSEENVSQRRAEVEEFERRLNEAISQMESMGFNNENGWLGQLLIAKDFDIGRVIDTLQSKQN